jgi:transaldolase
MVGIHAIFRRLRPLVDPSRICIKVPSTWEGIQACLELESKGIRTLATTIFSIEQAVLAAEACCKYIAPYVNELRVHFDPE